jgi:hypothetical protein
MDYLPIGSFWIENERTIDRTRSAEQRPLEVRDRLVEIGRLPRHARCE